MPSPIEPLDPHLERLFDWLRHSTVSPRPGMAARIRQRMASLPASADAAIDQLLAPQPQLRDPAMVAKVRLRLRTEPLPQQAPIPAWFRWLAPVAAAAVLALAFASFQFTGPRRQPAPALDPELTRIFALAATLHAEGDIVRLQSLDELSAFFH